MVRDKNLTDEERNQIVQWLLQNSKDGKVIYGKIKEAKDKFNCSRRTVHRLWADAKEQRDNGKVIHLKSKKPKALRRKRVHIDLELIQSIDVHKRSTVMGLTSGISCSKSTVWMWVDQGMIKAHNNCIRPHQTTPNKIERLRFNIEALEFDRIVNMIKFKSMHNTIHIDEKWFFISRANHRFHLTPGEVEPHRTCKSKKFRTKVMFMCAVCRPIFGEDGTIIFDGKIGIFPFTETVAAQRTSRNRPAGTLETKPIQSITKEVIKLCLINKILPAIRAKWPRCASWLIFIQQDNARPHIKDSDANFRAAASLGGFDIRLVNQPPNSPDTNVNDLGWFRAIQSIQVQTVCHNVEDLVAAVVLSFHELSPITLNNVFLSLQSCMLEIMRFKGENSYKIPHLKKDALVREERLPVDLVVPNSLVMECITCMIENQETIAEMEIIQNRLGLLFDDWTIGR